jgi:G:T-mismatch repair DNA endonuclease (very short patch repair protein)
VQLTCAYCSKPFVKDAKEFRYRVSKGHKQFYCTRLCKNLSGRIRWPLDLEGRYLAGESGHSIGVSLGVSGSAVINHLRSIGVTIRNGYDWITTKPELNPTKGRGHSEAAKAKIRAANIRQFAIPGARQRHSDLQRLAMSEGRVAKVSALEDLVSSHLDLLGLSYRRSALIRGPAGTFVACVDFLLRANLVLEVQGDYWHANPLVYPLGPKYPSQLKTVANDNRKKEVLTALAYSVVYLWESDVRRVGLEATKAVLCHYL